MTEKKTKPKRAKIEMSEQAIQSYSTSEQASGAEVSEASADLTTSDADSITPITEDEILQLLLNSDHGEVPVQTDSIEASIGFGSLVRELNNSYAERIAYYRSESGGSLSPDEARARAYHPPENQEEADELLSKLMRYTVSDIDFSDLGSLWSANPRSAQLFWTMMKSHAREEFESGHLASKALVPVSYMRTAWNVACFIGMRESLIDDWKPRGAMEVSLIDMMAQAFFMYQHWMKESVLRSQTSERQVHPDYERWQRMKKPKEKAFGFLDGYWYRPFVGEQTAIEHAAQMADRWNRIYMRTLRNLRDLRRYSTPVTINNPQQVNIAADGGQQVNVAKD